VETVKSKNAYIKYGIIKHSFLIHFIIVLITIYSAPPLLTVTPGSTNFRKYDSLTFQDNTPCASSRAIKPRSSTKMCLSKAQVGGSGHWSSQYWISHANTKLLSSLFLISPLPNLQSKQF
jgi:hypothetical protein